MSEHKWRVVGYVRVRAADQNEARQLEALGGVDRLFSERASVKNTSDHKQLGETMAYVHEGDIVRVKSPDCLARSTADFLTLVERLMIKSVRVEFIDNPEMNTKTRRCEFMLMILAAVAQLESATVREHQAERISIAKRNGTFDRAPKLTLEQIDDARRRVDFGVPKADKAARDLGGSRQALYAALSGSKRHSELVRLPA